MQTDTRKVLPQRTEALEGGFEADLGRAVDRSPQEPEMKRTERQQRETSRQVPTLHYLVVITEPRAEMREGRLH
jgi:hypothetical protein